VILGVLATAVLSIQAYNEYSELRTSGLIAWVTPDRTTRNVPDGGTATSDGTRQAPIKNPTKGDDPLKCNLSSANRTKKLNWFCIAGCEIIATVITSYQLHRVFEFCSFAVLQFFRVMTLRVTYCHTPVARGWQVRKIVEEESENQAGD